MSHNIGLMKRFLDLSLKIKVVLFIALIVIPFVLLMLMLLNSMGQTSLDVEVKALDQTTVLLKQELLNSVNAKADIFDIAFKNMIVDIEELKENIIKGGFEDNLLTRYYYKHQVVSAIYFINSSGHVSISPDIGHTGNVDIYQIEEFGFLTSGTGSKYAGRWLGPYNDFKGGTEIITYALPIWEESELAGVLGFDIPTTSMFTEFVNIDPSESSYTLIVKNNGDFISSSEKIFTDFGMDAGDSNIMGSRVIKDQQLSGIFTSTGKKEGVFMIEADAEHTQRIVTFSSISSFGGKLLTVSPLDEIIQVQKEKASEIQQAINNVAINGILYVVVITLIIIFMSFYFSDNNIIKPVTRLKEGIENLEKTGFGSKIPVTSRDEIGELTISFNEMAGNLKESRKKLEDYSRNLEKKVKDRTRELEVKDKKLLMQNDELKRLDKEKDEFISIAAHELKTPLTSIKGFAQLMQNDKVMGDKGKRKHYLELINQNTVRLYNLILDLVDSSRLSLGKLSLDISEVDVNKISNDIKENMSMVIKEKGITPAFSIGEGLPKVSADPERLMQVIRNLMVNAIHFTSKGGTISLSILKKGDFVQFDIKDNGEGIPKEKQNHIFSRFYQADSSLTRKVKGSGLGLSICQGLVQLMGGKIWFKSVEGKGTSFYFTLPIYKAGAKSGKKNNDSG